MISCVRAREEKSLLTQDTSAERKESRFTLRRNQVKRSQDQIENNHHHPNTHWRRRSGVTEKEQRVTPTQVFTDCWNCWSVGIHLPLRVSKCRREDDVGGVVCIFKCMKVFGKVAKEENYSLKHSFCHLPSFFPYVILQVIETLFTEGKKHSLMTEIKNCRRNRLLFPSVSRKSEQ